MTSTALIVLAAGEGSRMKTVLPKPLVPILGKPMLQRVIEAGSTIDPVKTILVVSEKTAGSAAAIGRPDIIEVRQPEPDGTGGAVRAALPLCRDCDRAIVLYADHPLLTADVVGGLLAAAEQAHIKAAVLTAVVADAAAYGRIVRNDGKFVAIVERNVDDPALRQGFVEINSGLMAIDVPWAAEAVNELRPHTRPGKTQHEFLLTDLIEIAVAGHEAGDPWPVATAPGTLDLLQGVNDLAELAAAESVLFARNRRAHQLAGVTIRLPETVIIEDNVTIGEGTLIDAGSIIRSGSRIGSRCVVGPNAIIDQSFIADEVSIVSSTVEHSEVGKGSDIGPYSHLRAGTVVGEHVHIGNFVETKGSRIADGVKIGHVSYLGDAEIGPDTNIGAGSITANFDGVHKNTTKIGANAFIGSDTMLIAPITIGDGARTGAGSVVTRDVPPNALVVGVPARIREPETTGDSTSGEVDG